MHSPDVLILLRRRPEWKPAVSKLRDLLAQHGDEACRRADNYGQIYQGRRGSMVLDVVTSRQRRYQNRVLPLVSQWEDDNDEHSLRWLSTHEPTPERYGLRPDEPRPSRQSRAIWPPSRMISESVRIRHVSSGPTMWPASNTALAWIQ